MAGVGGSTLEQLARTPILRYESRRLLKRTLRLGSYNVTSATAACIEGSTATGSAPMIMSSPARPHRVGSEKVAGNNALLYMHIIRGTDTDHCRGTFYRDRF